jgi:hypothetical protein
MRAHPAWLGLLCCLGLFAACYSSDYGRQTAATASMLRDLSAKLADYCRADFKVDGREVSSEEMGEFYYGLRKARSYLSEASSNSQRQSYHELAQLIDGYARLLNEADRYRLSGKPDLRQLQLILEDQNRVSAQAQAVLDSLAKDGNRADVSAERPSGFSAVAWRQVPPKVPHESADVARWFRRKAR